MNGHSLGITANIQVLDAMGRVKRTEKTFMESLFGRIGLGSKEYPMRSFVGEFLGRLLDTFTNGTPETIPGIFGPGTYNADTRNDYGLLLGCDTSDELRTVAPGDTASSVSSLILKPSTLATPATDGAYGATTGAAGLQPIVIGGYQGIKYHIERLFTNGTSQRVIREVFLVGKAGASGVAGTKYLYSRDNYAPLTATGANILPRGEVIQANEAISVYFDLVAITKKLGITVHENFFKMLFNNLFYGNGTSPSLMTLTPILGANVQPAALAHKIKSGADVDDWSKAGLDIKLHTPSFVASGYDNYMFRLGTSGGDPGLVMEANSQFPTKTLSLNESVASVNTTGKDSYISVEKTYSGQTAPYNLAGTSLVMNNGTGADAQKRDGTFRLASWQKLQDQADPNSENNTMQIGVDDILKVQFLFKVNCGDYTYQTAQPADGSGWLMQ